MRMSLRVVAAWAAVLAGTSGLPGGAPAGTVPATSWPRNLRLPGGIPEVEQAIVRFKAKDLERCQDLLKLSLGSPGRFAFRADARRRLERIEKPADRSAPPTGPG
jgi:hypothetical protein